MCSYERYVALRKSLEDGAGPLVSQMEVVKSLEEGTDEWIRNDSVLRSLVESRTDELVRI